MVIPKHHRHVVLQNKVLLAIGEIIKKYTNTANVTQLHTHTHTQVHKRTHTHTHTLMKIFNSSLLGITALYIFSYLVILNAYRIYS